MGGFHEAVQGPPHPHALPNSTTRCLCASTTTLACCGLLWAWQGDVQEPPLACKEASQRGEGTHAHSLLGVSTRVRGENMLVCEKPMG